MSVPACYAGVCVVHTITGDVMMNTTASQITSLAIVYSIVYLGADQRKHQSSESLAFLRGIHRWPVNSPHKWPVTRKIFPFNDVIMQISVVVSPITCNSTVRSSVFDKKKISKLRITTRYNFASNLKIQLYHNFESQSVSLQGRHMSVSCSFKTPATGLLVLYIYTYIYTHTHIHTHTHIYIYTYICIEGDIY